MATAFRSLFVLGLLAFVFAGCRKESGSAERSPNSPARNRVLVTNYPLQYFTDRLGGELVDVEFPMTSEGDPAFWEPDSQTIQRYQNADAIVINGATYEKWLVAATLPEAKLVDTAALFQTKFIQIENAVTHSHGPEGTHSHSGTVFTTWIDFDQAAQQATAIHGALMKLMPDKKERFDGNLAALLADLKKLDDDMASVAKKIGDRPVVASHPIYQYFARRYALNLKSVLWEPEVAPTDEAMGELKKVLESHPAKVMIWEGTPAPESVEKLKAIGIGSVVFDPCANKSDSGDWLAVMRSNVESLKTWADSQK